MEELKVYGPFIGRTQAQEQGLTHYFTGKPCNQGHISERFINQYRCKECETLKQKKRTIEKNKKISHGVFYGPVLPKNIAISQGLDLFFTCKPCKNGHFSPKYISSGSCQKCIQNKAAKRRKEYKDKGLVYRSRPLEETRIYSRKYRAENLEKCRKATDDWRKKNVVGNKERNVIHTLRTRATQLIEAGVLGNYHTSKTVGIDSKGLMKHLESQFKDGMSWDKWEIDHIRPVTSFSDLMNKEQGLVFSNWRNLQPLWYMENKLKSDKYTPLDELAWVERMQALGYEGELFLKYEEGNSY